MNSEFLCTDLQTQIVKKDAAATNYMRLNWTVNGKNVSMTQTVHKHAERKRPTAYILLTVLCTPHPNRTCGVALTILRYS